MAKEYSPELQKLFLEIMLQKSDTYVRVQNIFNTENFDRTLRPAATFIQEHCEQYHKMPTLQQINAVTGRGFAEVGAFADEHEDWFLNEFEAFTRRQELSRAILKAAELLEKDEYDPVEKLIKDAVQISLTRDLGLDYFSDPVSRLRELKDGNGQLSTGWNSIDRVLYGGTNRGELNIVTAGSGGGKSLFMQNAAVNWLMAGLNGVYITLELSQNLCAMRMDSMITGIPARDIYKSMDEVEMKVGMIRKKAGTFWLKYLPAQSNVNDIRAYVRELQIKTGKKIDFMCVDYLDLLMPVSVKVNPSDQFIKDKYVSEELRNLSKELNVLFLTASQLNRSAVDESEYSHANIAGGISKINTADNVFAIYASRSMREAGRYQIQFLKTRNSNGVGQKVELACDINTLRLRDLTESEEQASKAAAPIFGQIKPSSTLSNDPNLAAPPKPPSYNNTPKNGVDGTKLKQMLAQIKAGKP